MFTAQEIGHSPVVGKWCAAFHRVSGIPVHLLDPRTLEQDLGEISSCRALCRLLCEECERCHGDRSRFAERLRHADHYHAGPYAMRCGAGLTLAALPANLVNGARIFLAIGPMLVVPSKAGPGRRRLVERARSLLGTTSGAQLERMAREIPVRDIEGFRAAATLLRLLTEHLSHLAREMLAPPDRNWTHCAFLRRACELIEEHFTADIHLEGIACRLGVSRSYLSREFHRWLGLTFTEFLAARRVMEAKELLSNPSMPVTEALLAAGFQSISQGNRVFRAATGMSPRDFRASPDA